jgi:probable rRNA maturation factor
MIYTQVDDSYAQFVDIAALEKAASAVLIHEETSDLAALSIIIQGDEELRLLNLEFLGNDTPTDVLSFPADETDPDTGEHYLGDIIISFQQASRQSEQAGHPVIAELQLLVIHGTLHLLGYDHAEPEEKMDMWSAQSELIAHLGIPLKRMPD